MLANTIKILSIAAFLLFSLPVYADELPCGIKNEIERAVELQKMEDKYLKLTLLCILQSDITCYNVVVQSYVSEKARLESAIGEHEGCK